MKKQPWIARELSPYQNKLRDPRWQKKRLEVFERDRWTCRACDGTDMTLHVHHLYYEKEKDPWDYPIEAFVTLCEECHEEETQLRPQSERVLLDALRRAAFSHAHLLDLAFGFRFFSQADHPLITAQILAWALQKQDVMEELKNRFREHISTNYSIRGMSEWGLERKQKHDRLFHNT